jgi:hypothetical protein
MIMAQIKDGNLTVECPCCGARLIIDAKLGKVLRHEEPPQKRNDLDLGNVHDLLNEQARRREEIFRQSSADLKTQSELLDRKFAEALEKSKESPITRHTRDFDLD